MSNELISPQNLFEIDGFKTGRIELPSLHLLIDLSPDLYFRYDGPVPDLREYAWRLGDRLYPEEEIFTGINLDKIGGFNKTYFLTETPTPRGCLMAVRSISPRVNVCNEAHEAAEVAVGLGFTQLLEEHFRKLGFALSFGRFTKDEIGIAGGTIVALLHGCTRLLERDFLISCGAEEEYRPIIKQVLASRY